MKQRTRKLLTLLLIAAMVMSLMVPALAADTAQSETPYTYDAGDYTFGKISHPNSAPGQPDGLVDYTGNGTVAVTGTADGADGQGDRGQSYAWAAMAYGDYVYVGTCYAAMGQTLTAMDTVMGHKFDEETMRAELNAIFNGTFFYGQEDGGNSGGVLVKVNVHTGEMTLLMSKSLNGIAPLFRNAIRYKDKLYFCGSVNTNGRGGLPSIYEIDPSDDSITCVYQGLSNMQEYAQAYKAGVCTGIRGMAVYDGKLVISNVGVDGGYLLISDNPSQGFTKIATQSDLYNYPAVHYKDSVYGGGIWEIVEYNGSLYVAMCTGTPATRVGDNMRSFAIVRGTCSGDWNDPDAWTWTPVVGDKADGAKYTFGIDPARTRAAAYSVSTLGSLRRLNSLLAKLTDLVETNDIAGFVDIYQQVCDLYSGISDKLPDSMKELYEMLVRITELENMKDLVICLNKLSTATRGFGLYTITSENGKLTLDTLTRDGFGDPFNHGLRAFAANDEQGWMVIGTANPFMGTQLWRTTVDMTDPMDRFTDLDPNGWAYPSIEYCVRHGLMSGMSDTIFSPSTVTTRAQLVQVLYNFEGKPDVSDVAVPFTDAASGWYRDAVAWAYKTGVVDGMSPTTFAPNNTVTREQVAVILMRYLTKVCGVERTWTPDDLSGFADGGSVSGWARAGMADAVALGLFGGSQDSSGRVWLRPGAGTTRAETAALLQRMCTKVLGIG